MQVLVAGSTGMVGKELMALLLEHADVKKVVSIGRRKLDRPLATNVEEQVVDFSNLPVLASHDACFIALGTTMKQAGSQEAFRRVDFDAVVAVANAAKASGATRLGLVSALGSNAQSSAFYNKIKGEAEDAVRELAFETLVIARPSLLDSERPESRPGERIGILAARALRFAIPLRYRAIKPGTVARALLLATLQHDRGTLVLESEELERRGARM
jgi:uncharacterized protein YbjT (DUF2867 family)